MISSHGGFDEARHFVDRTFDAAERPVGVAGHATRTAGTRDDGDAELTAAWSPSP